MSVWASAEFDDHEQVCFFTDRATGLRCIVAIHSTALGPAVGGTRFKAYPDGQGALDDALRLSRAMSYKTALAGLPVGGGKAVIIADPAQGKSREVLHAYGRFVDRIGQTFATGEDVGMSVADIETVAEVTPFVGGTSEGAGDPSVHTAVGMLHGLHAVAEARFGRADLVGLRVAIQGLGAVGWGVAKRLHAAGALLTVADIRPEPVERAVALFGAEVMAPEEVHKARADIFAPCALGGGLNGRTVGEIRAAAVAGAANNQLADPSAGLELAGRGILFAPDYVINAGGVISGMEATTRMPHRAHIEFPPLEDSLTAIRGRLLSIFERAAREGRTPEATAEKMARAIIGR